MIPRAMSGAIAMILRSILVHSGQMLAWMMLATIAVLSAGCDEAATNAQSAAQSQPSTQPTSQPATQPATQAALPVGEHHGTVGAIPTLKGDPVFIHMVTSIERNDNPACVAFNVALAALKRGRNVVMCFDAGAVNDLKVWKGQPTAFRYELPDKLKTMLAQRYDVSTDELPQTYQQYLHALHEAGATIAANGFMSELVSLTEDPAEPGQLEPIVQMWSIDEILHEREQASIYFRY